MIKNNSLRTSNGMRIKILTTIIFSLMVVSAVTVFVANPASAQDYTLLAPLPGTNVGKTIDVTPTGFGNYLQKLFDLSLGIIIALAVIMIVIGGAQYLSTDAVFGIELGKEKLWNALQGLVIALGTVIILNTINPGLLKLNLDLGSLRQPEKVVVSKDAGSVGELGRKIDAGEIFRGEQTAKAGLLAFGIKTNNPPCNTVGQKNCTNVGGLPPYAINKLGVIASQLGCSFRKVDECPVVITGGTEFWNHGPDTQHRPSTGVGVVDLRKTDDLNKYITSSPGVKKIEKNKAVRCSKLGDQYQIGTSIYVDEGDHWHVCL